MEPDYDKIRSVYGRLMGFAMAVRDLEQFNAQMPQKKLVAALIEYVNEYETIVGTNRESAN